MPRYGWSVGLMVLAGLAAWMGCQAPTGAPRSVAEVGPARRAQLTEEDESSSAAATTTAGEADVDVDQDSEPLPGLSARPVTPIEPEPLAEAQEIALQIPDPVAIPETIAQQRDRAIELVEKRRRPTAEKDREIHDLRQTAQRRLVSITEKAGTIQRPSQVRLSLADVIRRAVENNYAIRVRAYNPAIETTRIVEAEAQFDAVFFTDWSYSRQDRPTSSQLASSGTDVRTFKSGVRKLLSSGMQLQAGYELTRTSTDLVFATLNPAYFNNMFVEFRQPFLRGFGLDFNRAQIEIYQLDRQISVEQLRQEVRETIFNTEQAYWSLVRARRAVAVSSRLLTDLETILDWLIQRKQAGYDVYGVQLNLTKSRIEQRRADFIRRCNDVRNAEDTLKALMNDPDLNLSKDTELVPTETLSIEPVVLDQLGEVSAALMHRSELHEARLTIEKAQIAIGVAKNQALPKLDLTFRYLVDGLGDDWHGAVSQFSENDFHEYLVALEFEWPLGNRGPQAGLRRARLQQAQAIAAQRAQIEAVIREVKQAIRDLKTSYDQIGPSMQAARASRDQLRATKARQERLDPPSLQVELDAHEALAAARDNLLQTLANYNLSLSNLERRKGTLLQYNNIVIRGVDHDDYQDPYRPVMP